MEDDRVTATSETVERKKIKLNLSPTSLSMYYKSPLLFYLTYIAKVPDDTSVPVCYGLSGNVVHECLEQYAEHAISKDDVYEYFAKQWHVYHLDEHTDVNGNTLNQTDYLKAVIRGIEIIDLYERHVCEEMFQFPLTESDELAIGIKGIVDLQAHHKQTKHPVVIDYKTSNSVNAGKDFERQALFYNYLIHKQKGMLPASTLFHYLKLNVTKQYTFTHTDLQAFEEELHAIAEEIISYGTDIAKYPTGDIDDLFNSKKQACLQEVARRETLTLSVQQNI